MRARFPAPPPGSGWIVSSGLLLGLSHPPSHLLIPSFIGLVPFAVWLDRLPEGEEGRRYAFRGGFWLGLIYFTLLLYWLVTSLVVYSLLAILAFAFTVGAISVLLGVVSTGVHHVRHRLHWPLWVGLPVFWTAAEWFRAHLGPISFPWQELGYSLTGFPRLIGFADLVGARGVSLWLVLLNAVAATGLLAWRGGRRRGLWLSGVSWLAVLAVPIGYSIWRWESLELRPAATVTVVQPNVPESIKLNSEVAVDSARQSVARLMSDWDREPRPDLLLLPETVIPQPIEPILGVRFLGRPDLRSWMGGLAMWTRASVLYGAIGIENISQEEWNYFNSAYLIDAFGRPVGRYDKRRLVPVVERVPFLNPEWFRWAEYFGGFSPGRASAPLETGDLRFGVLICYESAFADLGRGYRRQGADFLVNLTNDAWFGRESPRWTRSAALWQHPSHLVMRAIESRIGIARAANTGISQVLDPLGRVQHATELFEPAIFTADVQTTDEITLFARTGDVAGWLAALAAAAGVVLPRIRRRRDSV